MIKPKLLVEKKTEKCQEIIRVKIWQPSLKLISCKTIFLKSINLKKYSRKKRGATVVSGKKGIKLITLFMHWLWFGMKLEHVVWNTVHKIKQVKNKQKRSLVFMNSFTRRAYDNVLRKGKRPLSCGACREIFSRVYDNARKDKLCF